MSEEKYKIISASSVKKLEAAVNSYLMDGWKIGWKLSGGVCCVDAMVNGAKTTAYVQAVVDCSLVDDRS